MLKLWQKLPLEVTEHIVCLIGDDLIYKQVFESKYIRNSCKKIIDSEKKKKFLNEEISFVFCRDIVHYDKKYEEFSYKPNLNFVVDLFKSLVAQNKCVDYFHLFLLTFPILNAIEQANFANSILNEL